MNINKTANLLLNFAIKRLAETFGILFFGVGIFLLASLITYSPEDPNFVFPDNTKIENIFGFQGSFISDLFFQSVGLIAYLISVTFLITGIIIFKFKEFSLAIENIFYATLIDSYVSGIYIFEDEIVSSFENFLRFLGMHSQFVDNFGTFLNIS